MVKYTNNILLTKEIIIGLEIQFGSKGHNLRNN